MASSSTSSVNGLVWTRFFGSTELDYPFAISASKDGSLYVAGSTYGAWDGQANAGYLDAYVSKYTLSGERVWTRLIGNNSMNEAFGIATYTDGSVYVVGRTGSGTSTGIDAQPHASIGLDDAFITKFGADGTKAWTRQLGSGRSDSAHAVAVSSDGSVFVAGETNGTLMGQTVNGGSTYSGALDMFVTKYTSSGSAQWTTLFRGTGDEYGYAIAIDSEGSLFVSGITKSNSFDGLTNNGGADTFLAKFNASGVKQWTRIVGTASDDQATSIAIAPDGSVYVAGKSPGNLGGQTNHGGDDAFILKFTNSGSLSWTRLIGTRYTDKASGVAVGLDGTVYLTGTTNSDLNGQTQVGGYDSFLAALSPDGTTIWTRILGSSAWDDGIAVTSTSDGSVYMLGSAGGDIGGQTLIGRYDSFLSKWNPDTLDLISPTIALSTNKTAITASESVSVNIVLSEDSSNFNISDISISGGSLKNFLGSDTSYSVTFTPYQAAEILPG